MWLLRPSIITLTVNILHNMRFERNQMKFRFLTVKAVSNRSLIRLVTPRGTVGTSLPLVERSLSFQLPDSVYWFSGWSFSFKGFQRYVLDIFFHLWINSQECEQYVEWTYIWFTEKLSLLMSLSQNSRHIGSLLPIFWTFLKTTNKNQ